MLSYIYPKNLPKPNKLEIKLSKLLHSLQRRRILTVDDDTYIRELFRDNLAAQGYVIDTSSDGEDAEEKIRKKYYDFVSMDIMMPKKDGISTTETLRKDRVKCGPIVIFTNLPRETFEKSAMEAGADGYELLAEITPTNLLPKIESYLGKRTPTEIVISIIQRRFWIIALIILLLLLPLAVYLAGQPEPRINVY